jgi:3-hydroxybutyryl-CoA dehydrogenase
MKIQQLTVVGAGTMGNGIAHTFAQHGFSVLLYDTATAQLDKALQTIAKNLNRQLQKGKISEALKIECLGNIQTTTEKERAFSQADLIIEAVSENQAVKKQVFKDLEHYRKNNCILASNTSSLSITALGALCKNPAKVIGMHFMNPVPMMPLVEVIQGHDTDPEVIDTICQLSKQINKTPLVVSDAPGFVANRIAIPMINEAIETLLQGVSGVEEIDNIMKLGMGHPMGPLQLADFIGLDICLAIMEVLHQEFGQSKYAPSVLLRKLVAAGHLGRKTGIGFYNYTKDFKNPSVAWQFQTP